MENREPEPVPQWLDAAFLARAIRSHRNDDSIEIVKHDARSAFGEHYASKMFRASAEFRSLKFPLHNNEVLSVVIKAQPINDVKLESIVAEGPLFETEIEMLQKVIPAMHQLYESNGIDVKFAPELIYATTEPFSIIVLRDLTPDDYKVYRNAPGSVDESKLIIKRLAQFHAASMQLNESNALDLSSLKYSIYDSKVIVDFFLRDTIKAFREVVAGWEGFEDYIPRVERLITDIEAIGRKSYAPNAKGCGFNVLNHGDLHLRNILIKDDSVERRVESFYFVDFQLSVWCSPVVDLTYMMGLVKFDDSYDALKEELTMFYHQQLVTALNSIGYMKAPPSLLDLNVELLKHGAMNIAIWINFFPFLFIDWATMSVDDMMGNDSERSRNFKKSLFNSPALKKLLQSEMRTWLVKGWW